MEDVWGWLYCGLPESFNVARIPVCFLPVPSPDKDRGEPCVFVFFYILFFLKNNNNFFFIKHIFQHINFQKYVLIYKLYTKFLFSKVSYVNASGKMTGFFGSSEYFPRWNSQGVAKETVIKLFLLNRNFFHTFFVLKNIFGLLKIW